MIHKYEYYAHLTWFDRCQSAAVQFFRQCCKKWRSDSWNRVFNLFAVLCYFSLALIVADFAMAAGGSMFTMTAVQSAANTIAVALALGGGVHFQRLARQAGIMQAADNTGRAHKLGSSKPRSHADVQLFFMETHKAGVSINVARKLLAAGIGSIDDLAATEDCELLEIKGISPVTVHRLRQRFVPLS